MGLLILRAARKPAKNGCDKVGHSMVGADLGDIAGLLRASVCAVGS